MNIVFFVVLLLLIGGGVKGYKRGMIEEVNTVIALVIALIVIGMFVVAVKGYMDHETLRTILGIVCLTIAVLVYKVVDFILSSLKIISIIPVIRGVNKLLGFGVGVVEAVLLIWALFLIIVAFEFGGISSYILADIKENLFLTYLFQNNYLSDILSDTAPVISNLSELSGIEWK
ncbi:MAG: CvpA family protein [Lachnospiraceae bacterium]|nr:CvpA family protein [Lachnospiraceae bacterium]